jgi:hypothetical protein
MGGRAGERDGVQAAGLQCGSAARSIRRCSRRSRSQTIAGRSLVRTCSCSWSSISFVHLTGHRPLPVADTEVGCPQSLGMEAGILAGVLEATACDPSKLKPTRQTT